MARLAQAEPEVAAAPDCRQPLPYKIREELPVIREHATDAQLKYVDDH